MQLHTLIGPKSYLLKPHTPFANLVVVRAQLRYIVEVWEACWKIQLTDENYFV